MRTLLITLLTLLTAPRLFAYPLACDLAEYRASPGLEARVQQKLIIVLWMGQERTSLRARFGLQNGQPIIRDIAVRRHSGPWAVLGENLRPEYHITSGVLHFELNGTDPDGLRFKDQKDYFEGSRRASDKDFLVLPWEEPSAFFGGHYNILWPQNVYWSKARKEGQPFTETDPVYGKVYHTGSAADVQKMMDAEGAYWYHAHPRTKGTTGYPDAIFEKEWPKNDRYLGVAFKPGMGMDLSEKRLCEWRCFDAVDTMNNLYANSGVQPKYVIADIDTYRKGPEDDLYPNFPVNYLKLDHVPGPDEDWTPILRALRDGNYFVTTGEVLIKSYGVEGRGNQRMIVADVEWTFPLEFAEVVWGDGKNIHSQTFSATDLPPFGTKQFVIPFDATGKSWIRFAVWDSAGDGAFVQPVWLNVPGTRSAGD